MFMKNSEMSQIKEQCILIIYFVTKIVKLKMTIAIMQKSHLETKKKHIYIYLKGNRS